MFRTKKASIHLLGGIHGILALLKLGVVFAIGTPEKVGDNESVICPFECLATEPKKSFSVIKYNKHYLTYRHHSAPCITCEARSPMPSAEP